MLQAEETLLAVRNNALWCDTICRSHGLPAEYDEHLWFVRGEAPRFYPNAVTLTEHGLAAQMAGLRELIDERPGGALAVKDSFRTLDLGSLGFRVLFEAEWIWRPAGRALPGAGIFGARWARVRDPAELANWEQAWAGDNAVGLPRLFMPALLADTTIAFLAAYHDSRIFAGAIANRTGDVVGISNVFAPANQGEHIWGGCISAATQIFPGLPLVGYESGDDLGLAQAAGFETLAPLRVWVREAT